MLPARLRERNNDLLRLCGVASRIVVVTAFPSLDTSFDAGAVGADGYVDGPLFGDEVVSIVDQALKGPYPVRYPSADTATGFPAGVPDAVRDVANEVPVAMPGRRSPRLNSGAAKATAMSAEIRK